MASKPVRDLGKALTHTKTDKRIDILRRLQDAGSISEAARRAGVSYKAAWQAIDILSNLAGTPLVEKVVGGSGGGGAQLTAAGRELLKASSELDIAKHQLLKKSTPLPATALSKGMLGLQTTMRNQFPATVTGIAKKSGTVRVGLTTKGASVFHARITATSAELFDLQIGQNVLVLFKATAVQILNTPTDGSHNVVPGVVVRKSKGGQQGELNLLVEPGVMLVGFSSQPALFNISDEAYAQIDETAIVLALTHA